MLEHVIITAARFEPEEILVIVGHGAETVQQSTDTHDNNIKWILQNKQLGTGHAVKQAIEHVNENTIALVLYGDVPLISYPVLEKLVQKAEITGFSLLSSIFHDPHGYGRIIRDSANNVIEIIEENDADSATKNIKEINTGIMAVKSDLLKSWLDKLTNNNSQKEYYLTDIVQMAVADNIRVYGLIAENPTETKGINSRKQQAKLERFYQKRVADELLEQGVSITDPGRIDIRGKVSAGKDVVIDVNVILEGNITIGDNVKIGANSIIKNSSIATNTTVMENCVIEDAIIGKDCNIGPFARIRPETELKGKNNVGNFVEIKKSTIGSGSKINHLSYVGDTKMGDMCNIGAGTITCNYDGAHKHQTRIGNNVFVGSNSQLVAPIMVDDDVTIGAGTTLTKSVYKENTDTELLALSRTKQTIIKKWQRPKK